MRIHYLPVLNTLIELKLELDSLEGIYKILESSSGYEEWYPDMRETSGYIKGTSRYAGSHSDIDKTSRYDLAHLDISLRHSDATGDLFEYEIQNFWERHPDMEWDIRIYWTYLDT